MRAPPVHCIALSALLSAGLPAQAWPQGYATTVGGGSHATPFTISSGLTPARTRSVIAIDEASLPFAPGHTLAGMSFRRDAQHAVGYAGYSANIQVRIRAVADALTLTAAAHKVFESSHQVFDGVVVVPSAVAPPGSSPAPFSLQIPFATGWTYPGGDLAIELTVAGPSGATWRCDAVDMPWSDGGRAVGMGGGCATSGGDLPPLYVEDLRSVVPGGSAEFAVDRLTLPPAGFAVIFLLGDPAPGIGLGVLGMDPSCRGFVYPILSPTGLFGNRMVHHARGGFALPLPSGPGLAGAKFAGQALIVDLQLSSSLLFCASQAVEVELGAPPIGAPFVGRSQWIYGAQPAGIVQGLRVGRPNRVPVIEFF